MSFTEDHFDEVRRLFHELSQLDPDLRRERLDVLSDTNASLCSEVEDLLFYADAACPQLDGAPSRILKLLDDYSREKRLGDECAELGADVDGVIGPYILHEILGQGGMGVVYRAEQSEPLQREVAIKLVRPGMATGAMLARFEAERQTLATMNHPNIAAIYDAGVTEDGRPYFVMQCVRGFPITQYCDEMGLTIDQRLALFQMVCDAVQHAHRRGVIHRDLKPSNVLVEDDDGEPTPHVIDFGIAKALAAPGPGRFADTSPGVLLGAPLYMSPEQAAHDESMDTRSDVYSLGVILHELLCGLTPIDADELRRLRSSEVPAFIERQEATAPSRRFQSKPKDDRARIAAARGCSERELVSALRGELDWITMKALARERGNRYESPAELSADLKRRARREPVEAGPPSVRYRLGRLLARNRVASVAAALVLLAVFAGVAGVGWQSRQTNIQMRNSQQVNHFLHRLLALNSPWRAGGASPTLRAVLDEASADLRENPALTPLTQARLHNTIGATYWGLGDYVEADKHFEDALILFISELGEANEETIRVMSNLSHIRHRLGRSEDAEAIGRRGLELAEKQLDPNSPVIPDLASNLGGILDDIGEDSEAEMFFRRAVDGHRATEEASDLTQSLANLGSLLMELQKLDEAQMALTEAIEIGEREFGRDHPATLLALTNYGVLKQGLGEGEEGLAILRDVFSRSEHVFGKSHIDTIKYSRRLIIGLARTGRMDEAEALAERMRGVSKDALGPTHDYTMHLTELHVATVGMGGRLDDALASAQLWYDDNRAALGPDHEATRRAARLIAETYDSMGDDEREAHWRSVAAGEADEPIAGSADENVS